MTSSCFVTMLGQYLAKFRAAAEVLVEARQFGQPVEAAEADLLQHLMAYTWAVRSRALLLLAADADRTSEQSITELYTRLSVVETLVALRCGTLPKPTPQEPNEEPPVLPALWQRLASAESRVFHLYGVASLN